jgi:hypothetical protein
MAARTTAGRARRPVAALTAHRRNAATCRHARTCCDTGRFGEPSSYSLPRASLARHARQLRRQGWQRWELLARFDLRTGSDA